MTGKKQMLNNRMKLLWDSYVKEIPHKIRAISVSWQTILDMRHGDYSANLRDLIRGLHTIGGTASTFGHVKLGIAAHRAERELKLIQETGELSASTEKQFALCLVEMNNIIAALSVDENLDSCLDVGQYEVRTRKNVTNRTIVLVDDDEWFSSNLALQLNCFGYEVITFNRLQDMEEALPTLDAACFIMDLSFPEGIAAGAETVRRLWAVKNYAIPVVFLSKRNDTISRLEAVKAGSDAYFLKPVRIIELIDKLDQLTSQSEPPPYKVLVVDDEQVVAEYHALLLEQNGIQARILTNPLQVLDAISDFNPDLILMDLNMPKCNGYELSKVIRQVPAYFRIPIVFLSQETDPELQMQAMNTGGDDFLTKPVNPEYFLSSVRVRAERMRILRTLMERDGLSGLYNHSVMKEQIESVFIQAARSQMPATLGIIDLDFFKKINDTYGHITGDMVIVIVSRLLEQRLRCGDIVGRVGGEEFAFIMQNTTPQEAYTVIESVRCTFGKIVHEAPAGSFTATFSCGLAALQTANDPAQWYDAADSALYKAKKQGRNRTCIAQVQRKQKYEVQL